MTEFDISSGYDFLKWKIITSSTLSGIWTVEKLGYCLIYKTSSLAWSCFKEILFRYTWLPSFLCFRNSRKNCTFPFIMKKNLQLRLFNYNYNGLLFIYYSILYLISGWQWVGNELLLGAIGSASRTVGSEIRNAFITRSIIPDDLNQYLFCIVKFEKLISLSQSLGYKTNF